jgi:hypothetical protein
MSSQNPLQKDAERQNRVAVHTFDEDATPAEKASAAGKARDQLKSIKTNDQSLSRGQYVCSVSFLILQYSSTEVQIDKGASDVVPTISIEDAEGTPQPVSDKSPMTPGLPLPPGTLDGAAGAIPDWYKVGWRQSAGIDNPATTDVEHKDRSILELFVSEQYYGTWYHNAALVIFVRHIMRRVPR